MKKNKKVYMILTNGFDPDVRVYKEAKYLTEKNFDVTILCWDRKCEYKDNQEENLDGIKIKRFLIPSEPGSGLKQIFPYFKFILSVRKYLKQKEYSYLHCHDFDGIITGIFTKNRNSKKLIFDMHEFYNNYAYAKNIFFKKIFQLILKKCSYVIYVNEGQLTEANLEETNKYIYLPNFPEINMYVPIVKTKSNDVRVNYVGALRDYYSLKCLLDLKLDKVKPGLYGTGICYNKLKREYMKANIYGKFDGVNDSSRIYQNTDVLYCVYDPNIDNWKRAYPVKLFEAIITHTPIIVSKDTKAGAFVEKYDIGKTVNYNNSENLSYAIKEIKNNYKSYVKNIEKISNNYNWDTIKTNLNKIYF